MSEGKGRVRLFMGGSFNPITIAHLRILELARDFVGRNLGLRVEAAVISPVGDFYPEKRLQSASDRVAMCKLAAETTSKLATEAELDPWIRVDDWESKQDKWIRTLDNLKRQQAMVDEEYEAKSSDECNVTSTDDECCQPTQAKPRMMLVCGTDLIHSFKKPGLWLIEDLEVILRDFGILCITRKGFDDNYLDAIPSELSHLVKPTGPFSGIHVVEEWVSNEISSTKVRFGLKNGLTVQYLVTDSVFTYIQERHLYKTEPE